MKGFHFARRPQFLPTQSTVCEHVREQAAPPADDPRGKTAILRYRVGARAATGGGQWTWLEIELETGRTHQIRVHMKEAGHPIVCDALYGDGKPLLVSSLKSRFKLSRDAEEEKPILGRLALHSFQLEFKGMDGKSIELEAPLPKDMKALLQQLRKWKSS